MTLRGLYVMEPTSRLLNSTTMLSTSLPALHISLGVIYWLYILLEQASHELNLAMAREKSDGGQMGAGSLLQQLHTLQEERDAHEQAAQTLNTTCTLHCLRGLCRWPAELCSRDDSILQRESSRTGELTYC